MYCVPRFRRVEAGRFEQWNSGLRTQGCRLLPLIAVIRTNRLSMVCGLLLASVATPAVAQTSVYPASPVITGIQFDFDSTKTLAPGSDNWPVTWADDGHQYTSWGDGGGFGGDNNDGRVSLGFGRVEGAKDNYLGFNVWGGKNPETPALFGGKCKGIISIGGNLYMWRSGGGSNTSSFDFQTLYSSTDHGVTWVVSSVDYDQDDFPGNAGFFSPTFLQFGKDYHGARDGYVYTYAPEIKYTGSWEVQYPGEITLLRVPIASVTDPAAHEYFTGLDLGGQPTWTTDIAQRQPVFEDAINGVMRISVSYNKGLRRYLLTTQQVSRFQASNGHIGIYDAPEPWGPWTTVLFANPWTLGAQTGSKTVFWNFSNKWLSADGKSFVLVYTGPGADNWGTVEGTFEVVACTLPDDDLLLTDDTIDESTTFEACNSITAGPNLAIHDDVAFRTRGQIILRHGFSVASSASFRAEIDPLTGAE